MEVTHDLCQLSRTPCRVVHDTFQPVGLLVLADITLDLILTIEALRVCGVGEARDVASRQQKSPENRAFCGISQPSCNGLKRNLVPRRGLEPPRLAAQVPETCASTNSAIWATRSHVRGSRRSVNSVFEVFVSWGKFLPDRLWVCLGKMLRLRRKLGLAGAYPLAGQSWKSHDQGVTHGTLPHSQGRYGGRSGT